MSITATFDGLEELQDAMRDLPEAIIAKVSTIVRETAQQTGLEVAANYPVGPTGNLKRRVRTDVTQDDRNRVRAVVKSQAPHAHIYERGTRSRATRRGWFRGSMPAPPFDSRMIPRAIRARKRMYERVAELLRAEGFLVTEQAA